MKILLIDDEESVANSLLPFLKEAGFTVDVALDGEKGRISSMVNDYDLVLLDYNLPQLSGREILLEIRREKKRLPVIILTARAETSDKIELLNYGADDYITKPFDPMEMLARIKAVLRRPAVLTDDILEVGAIKLNSNALTTSCNNKDVKLTNKEFCLLEYLMRNKGRALSRRAITDNVWNDGADAFSNTIEVHIMRLRQKLNDYKNKLIISCPSRGYKIDDNS